MKELNKKITDFHYGKFSLFFSSLFFIPSFFYFLVISIKNFLYEKGFLKEFKINSTVICVGNLTTGGVGKTPVVIELANYLLQNGKKVSILSRGYGGKADKTVPLLVRNEKEIIIDDVELTGDEVNLISKNTAAFVVICADRKKGAEYISNVLKADIILMDDGFSNRKIYKDLNLILIDTEKMFGNGFCLPFGPLREPVSEIKRAGSVVFIDKTGKKNPKLDNFINALKIPYQICKMKTGEIYNIKTGEIFPENLPVFAFSGIGSPEQFYNKLSNVKETMSFNDHIEYNQKIVDEINGKMAEYNLEYAVTTEKDMVKLLKFKNIEKFYALKLKPELNSFEILKRFL